jgi:hypothetical protein
MYFVLQGYMFRLLNIFQTEWPEDRLKVEICSLVRIQLLLSKVNRIRVDGNFGMASRNPLLCALI